MIVIKKITLGIFAISLLAFMSGCTAFLAGAGTIGMGMDTIRLERYTDYDTAWDATIEALHDLSANIELEDKTNNLIKASMSDYKIRILVQQSTQESVFVDVSVRQRGLPSLRLSNQIIEQINVKIRQKN